MKRNVSLTVCYLLKFTRCLLLIVKSLVTHCNAEVARCKKSLMTCLQKLLVAKKYPLLVVKFADYSMQKNKLLLKEKFACYSSQKLFIPKSLLVTHCNTGLLLVAVYACWKKSLISCCKICLLLVAEVAHCKKLLVTCYEGNLGTNFCLDPIKIG